MGGICGCFSGLVENTVDVLPTVTEDQSPVSSVESLASSIISSPSDCSTALLPLSCGSLTPGQVAWFDRIYGHGGWEYVAAL